MTKARRPYSAFAQLLRQARLDAEITQATLGSLVATEASQISHWESGRRAPDVRQLEDLRHHLKISDDMLISWVRALAEGRHMTYLSVVAIWTSTFCQGSKPLRIYAWDRMVHAQHDARAVLDNLDQIRAEETS